MLSLWKSRATTGAKRKKDVRFECFQSFLSKRCFWMHTYITYILQASEIRPKLMLPTVDFECKVADEQLATVAY